MVRAAAAPKVPAEQDEHEGEETTLNWPAAQATADAAPAGHRYPAGHARHAPDPAEGPYDPAAHPVQFEDPGPLKVPTGQVEQAVALLPPGLYWPARHSICKGHSIERS